MDSSLLTAYLNISMVRKTMLDIPIVSGTYYPLDNRNTEMIWKTLYLGIKEVKSNGNDEGKERENGKNKFNKIQ